jgi:hypothetical protein
MPQGRIFFHMMFHIRIQHKNQHKGSDFILLIANVVNNRNFC